MRRPVLVLALAAASAPASAAFFQIAEQSASGMGNAFAGGAAIAEDASTVWYNPAGMTRLARAQLVASGSYILPSFTANVNSASTALGFPIAGAGGDAGQAALVPSVYLATPVTDKLSLGFGINAPFGLATDYDSGWAGRYYALHSDIKTINYNLAGAFKVNEVFSAGVGINYQTLEANLTQAVDFATLCTAASLLPPPAIPGTAACGAPNFVQPGSPNDGKATVTAKGDSWGYNLGFLAQLGHTRLGLAYRSKMNYKLNGNFDINVPANVPPALLNDSRFRLINSYARSEITLPSTLSLSVYQDIGSRWAIMADVTRTGWKDLPELRIMFDSGQADQVVTFNLKDAYRYSVGATYRPSDSWVFRAGVALDRSPVTSAADRTPRLPDSDRRWLSVGAGWRFSRSLDFDLSYAYITLADSSVTKVAGAPGAENFSRGNLSADYKGLVQIFAAQARWAF
jgi:long-chain fatty acid transport protein